MLVQRERAQPGLVLKDWSCPHPYHLCPAQMVSQVPSILEPFKAVVRIIHLFFLTFNKISSYRNSFCSL